MCGTCGAAWVIDSHGVPFPATTRRPPTRIGGLTTATAVSLALIGLCYLVIVTADVAGAAQGFTLELLTSLVLIVVIPLFLTWFYLVRRNAGLWGAQRRGQYWTILGWLVPVLFLWFPFQIADDAWQASQPFGQPRRSRSLVVLWWVCWLAAWFTGFYDRTTTYSSPDGTVGSRVNVGFQIGSNVVSAALTAAAALFGAAMVWILGRMQEARIAPVQYPV
jgi:hypothetical protein